VAALKFSGGGARIDGDGTEVSGDGAEVGGDGGVGARGRGDAKRSKGAVVDGMERRRGQATVYWGLGRNTDREMIERDEMVALHLEQIFGLKPIQIQATDAMTVGVGRNTVTMDAPQKANFLRRPTDASVELASNAGQRPSLVVKETPPRSTDAMTILRQTRPMTLLQCLSVPTADSFICMQQTRLTLKPSVCRSV
jgi:hypothetical protein